MKYPVNRTCHKLRTKIYEIIQNFKGDLTSFCENFLNLTLRLPQYSRKSFFFFFFPVRSLWKTQQCVIYVHYFIKAVVKWSEKSVIWIFYGNCLPDGPYSVRFYLSVWGMACMYQSKIRFFHKKRSNLLEKNIDFILFLFFCEKK